MGKNEKRMERNEIENERIVFKNEEEKMKAYTTLMVKGSVLIEE